MSLSNCSFLVHTFNQYERYWDGFLKGFHEHLDFYNYQGLDEMPLYFGTDTEEHSKHDFQEFKVLYSGKGEWSDRLINLLGQISTEYVIYIQEDMWPNDDPPNIEELLHWMQQNDVWRLQISPIVQF